MDNNKIKAVAVSGYVDSSGRLGSIICLGAFQSINEAYGKAYLHLTEFATNDEYTITPPMELEGETGYGMYLKNDKGKTEEYAYILFNYDDEDVEQDGA